MKKVNIFVLANAHSEVTEVIKIASLHEGDLFGTNDADALLKIVPKDEKCLLLIHEDNKKDFQKKFGEYAEKHVVYTMYKSGLEINHASGDVPFPLKERALESILNKI